MAWFPHPVKLLFEMRQYKDIMQWCREYAVGSYKEPTLYLVGERVSEDRMFEFIEKWPNDTRAVWFTIMFADKKTAALAKLTWGGNV